MRIIDEKGRLFGIINLIDLLLILTVLFALPMFYFGYKAFRHAPKTDSVRRGNVVIPIEIGVTFKNLTFDEAGLIMAQDKESDYQNTVIAEVLKVIKVEPNFITVKLSDTETFTKEDATRKQVTLKLALKCELKEDNQLYYKERAVKIGSPINFKTDKYEINGFIVRGVDEFESSNLCDISPVILEVLFGDLSPAAADLVTEGNYELDAYGQTIAKIISCDKAEPYSYKVNFGEGKYATKINPERKQVLARLAITGKIKEGFCYFKGNRVAIDSKIEFRTDKYVLSGAVIGEPREIRMQAKVLLGVNVIFKDLNPAVAGQISQGDCEKDDYGSTIIKVLSVGVIEPNLGKVNMGNNNYISEIDPGKKQVLAKLEIIGSVYGNAFYFRGRRIAIDSIIDFNSEKYNISGIIVQEPAPVKDYERKWVNVKLACNNLPPELAEIIAVGDEERDISENPAAKITNLVSIDPVSSTRIQIKDNELSLVGAQSQNKNVVIEARILCSDMYNEITFKGTPVKIGNTISLEMKKYDLYARITKIE